MFAEPRGVSRPSYNQGFRSAIDRVVKLEWKLLIQPWKLAKPICRLPGIIDRLPVKQSRLMGNIVDAYIHTASLDLSRPRVDLDYINASSGPSNLGQSRFDRWVNFFGLRSSGRL